MRHRKYDDIFLVLLRAAVLGACACSNDAVPEFSAGGSGGSTVGASSAGKPATGTTTGTASAAGAPAAAGGDTGSAGRASAGSSTAGAGTGTVMAGASAAGAGGAAVAAGTSASAGAAGAIASAGRGGSAAGTAGAAGKSNAGGAGAGGSAANLERFSFFVTSLAAMQRLSKSQNGFGGDLRFGKADGLAGADEICRQIAESSMPGSSAKTWHAFLSATKGPSGMPVNAIDRVGSGPWYDRIGRLVAQNKSDLAQSRPSGADPAIINDLPNESGVPNHAPEGTMQVDNHDILTGSSATGTLYAADWTVTCHDWTSTVGSDGKPRVGHSWPRQMGGGGPGGGGPGGGGPGGGGPGGGGPGGDMANWMSSLDEAGCAPGVNLIETGPPDPANPTVGSGGGYGGIYCFALSP